MKHFSLIALIGVAVWGVSASLHAQTTLSGDHIVTGNLNVGSSSAMGNLSVTGQTGTTAPPAVSVTGDGGVVFQGTFGTGTIPATGAGARMMWYPKKAAFRVGAPPPNFLANSWDDANIGNYSMGFGNGGIASGVGSVSFNGGSASGAGAVALNPFGTAGGVKSIASSSSPTSISLASNTGSIAIGGATISTGDNSIGLGALTSASGSNSMALNFGTTASGANSISTGNLSIVSGNSAFAAGNKTTATSYASFVIGQNNAVEGSSATTWVPSDPLLVVGNGTGVTSDPANVKNRNAFVIYKDGTAKFTKRQGDIAMGEFGTPGSGD